MQRALISMAAGLITIVASFAVGQDVRYNYDQNTDFSKFKTYKWVELKNAQNPGDLLDKQIKSSFEAQLAAKGLTKVEDDSANLYVGYQVGIGQEKEFTSYNTDWGYGTGWSRSGWYGSPGTRLGTTSRAARAWNAELGLAKICEFATSRRGSLRLLLLPHW